VAALLTADVDDASLDGADAGADAAGAGVAGAGEDGAPADHAAVAIKAASMDTVRVRIIITFANREVNQEMRRTIIRTTLLFNCGKRST
jgi:hypothetical protein